MTKANLILSIWPISLSS